MKTFKNIIILLECLKNNNNFPKRNFSRNSILFKKKCFVFCSLGYTVITFSYNRSICNNLIFDEFSPNSFDDVFLFVDIVRKTYYIRMRFTDLLNLQVVFKTTVNNQKQSIKNNYLLCFDKRHMR